MFNKLVFPPRYAGLPECSWRMAMMGGFGESDMLFQ